MGTWSRLLPSPGQISAHLPAIAGSMVIAELFYKFHSFTLECIAFLATWYILYLPTRAIAARLSAARGPRRAEGT